MSVYDSWLILGIGKTACCLNQALSLSGWWRILRRTKTSFVVRVRRREQFSAEDEKDFSLVRMPL